MDPKGIELLRAANQELERQLRRMRSAYDLQQKEIIYWKGFVISEYPESHVEHFEAEVKALREAHHKLYEDSSN